MLNCILKAFNGLYLLQMLRICLAIGQLGTSDVVIQHVERVHAMDLFDVAHIGEHMDFAMPAKPQATKLRWLPTNLDRFALK